MLGANDGIVSTASLMLGVAASAAPASTIAIAGVSALVAGAASMAAGEYVSVSTQSDAERADTEREKEELRTEPSAEKDELVRIYQARGLTPELAKEVADQLMKFDALGAHLRDELGMTEQSEAHPLQAAAASALAFSAGAAIPLVVSLLMPASLRQGALFGSTLICLAGLGALGAKLGGAPWVRASVRVTLGGAAAMALTWAVGHFAGVAL